MIPTLQESVLRYKGDVDTIVSASGFVSAGADRTGGVPRTAANFQLTVGPANRRGRLPLISCLMPTKNRVEQAKLAIASYQSQTWPNKELIILDQSMDDKLGAWVTALNDPSIRYLSMPNLPEPLGIIRNRTLDLASGEIICTWDDDDMHHCARLEIGVAAMIGAKAAACLLIREVVWMPRHHRAGLRRTEFYRNSLMVSRAVRFRYAPTPRAEDVPPVQEIVARQRVAWLDLPELYVYVAHGNNTWDTGTMERWWGAATHRTEGREADATLAQLSRAFPIAEYAKAIGLGAGPTAAPVLHRAAQQAQGVA